MHLVSWDEEGEDKMVEAEEWHNSPSGTIHTMAFMVPSPAWVDPAGRMVVSTHDYRPFQRIVTNSIFTVFPNNFDEVHETMEELSRIACDPVGMAWSTDNSTVYFSDAHTKNVSSCEYVMAWEGAGGKEAMDVRACTTLLHMPDLLGPGATPRGLAVDSSNHLWVAVEAVAGKGAVLEVNPETKAIISTIGQWFQFDISLLVGHRGGGAGAGGPRVRGGPAPLSLPSI